MGLLAVPTAIVFANIFGIPVFLVDGASGGSLDDPSSGATLIATFLQDAVFVGTAIGFAAMVARPSAWDFGLRRPRAVWPAVGWSLLAYVAIAVIGAVASLAFGVGEETQENILNDLGIAEGSALVFVAAFVVCVLAPLCEEILFRGFVFPALRGLGVWLAAFVSGAIFGLIHITNFLGGDESWRLAAASIVTLITLGTLFALLYWRTDSLLPCIGLHAVNNSIAFGVMQDWTWQIAPLMSAALLICGISVWLAMRFWRTVPEPWPAPLSSP
jgi:membrane protease YdiL (CAAX protease family)